MNQKLYRLQSRAGLSLAITAAGAASEDSELSNEQTFCHTSLGVRDRQGYAERTHTMSATFSPYSTTRAARRYVSPRTRPLNEYERETRGLSYMLKEACPEAALQVAAAEMAALVWGPCHLIPAPDHTGDTSANRRLAKAIAAHVKGGAEVHDILTRTAPAPSSCDRHRAKGPAVSVEEHNITRRDAKPIPCRRTFIVDNVLVGGNTIRACFNALGFGTGLVFGDASFHHE
jgi:hypothetical protein